MNYKELRSVFVVRFLLKDLLTGGISLSMTMLHMCEMKLKYLIIPISYGVLYVSKKWAKLMPPLVSENKFRLLKIINEDSNTV